MTDKLVQTAPSCRLTQALQLCKNLCWLLPGPVTSLDACLQQTPPFNRAWPLQA